MTDKFLIKGKTPLFGEVEISGSKNEAGAILAGVILAQKSEINNLPIVSDIKNQIEILMAMGAKIKWISQKKIKVETENLNPEKIPLELFEKMRISVLLVGPLLAKFRKIKIPSPGGDKIGLRPILTHIDAFQQLGVKVERKGNFYIFEAPKKLTKKKVILKEFSVTATETLMCFLANYPEKTQIEIAAAEPHVQNLGKFLIKMGAEIVGLGTHTITIKGRKKLENASWKIGSDPIETGTFLIALAITGGEGKIKNTNPQDLLLFLKIMKEIGINFEIKNNEMVVKKSKNFFATKIQILPHPGFPTDLQPQACILLTQAKGKSLVHEPLYENRFQHLQELRKMGADIEITDPHRALIFGKTELIGTKVNSSDIRSGASLVLAGLIAKGETLVENISQIERGYENFKEKLKKLGADIKKI